MRGTTIVLCALLHAGAASAQTSDHAGQPPRVIAALSDEDIRGLLDGAGMGYARAAELNGIPGPRHVLDLADSLHLTPAQRDSVADVFEHMQSGARRLGAVIVERERELDQLFLAHEAEPEEVGARTVELGELYGRLRAVHLNAHLATARLLRDPQISQYRELRGYADASPSRGHDDHH